MIDARLLMACPCYGPVDAAFLFSLVETVRVLAGAAVSTTYCFAVSPGLGTLRNRIAAVFLRSDCTHLLFADVDQGFEPRDVLRWLAADVDIVGAPIAVKQTEPLLACAPMQPIERGPHGFVRALRIGTGLLLIKRSVFERVRSIAEEYMDNDAPGWDFFGCAIAASTNGPRKLLSEDLSFIARARSLGVDVWIDPEARVVHYGRRAHEVTPAMLETLR